MNSIFPAFGNVPSGGSAHDAYFDDLDGEAGTTGSTFPGLAHLISPVLTAVTIHSGEIIDAVGATYSFLDPVTGFPTGAISSQHGGTGGTGQTIDLSGNSITQLDVWYGTWYLSSVDGEFNNFVLQIRLTLASADPKLGKTPTFGSLPRDAGNAGWIAPEQKSFSFEDQQFLAFLGFTGQGSAGGTFISALGCVFAPS